MIKSTFILNFFKLYNMIWGVSLPFLAKHKRLKLDFQKRVSCAHHSKADIWIQAASAGEAYLAVNILKELSPQRSLNVLITSTTSQGIDILKTRSSKADINKYIDLKIDWFPFDRPHTIREAVKIINPCIMVLLETEIWPALLFFLKQNRTPIFIINARVSKKSHTRYMRTKFLWKHLAPDHILATSNQDALRYEQIFETATVKTMSNIKFESIETEIPDVTNLERIKQILPKTLPLTLLASVRKQEEKESIHILKNILKKFPNQTVAIFPRHMHRVDRWKKHLYSQNLDFQLRSRINSCLESPGIILWDIFGELKTVYGFASVVFIGGSLKPLGGQNFIEPAIQGAVTVTGPYYEDFAWVTDDIFKKEIVIKKDNWQSIAQAMIKFLKTPDNRSSRAQMTREYIRSKKGGTRQACDEILKAFDGFV